MPISPISAPGEAIDKDPDINGILLYINSTGGNTGSASILMLELLRLKKKLPIVAFVKDLATSCGYCVAATSDCIIASPGADIGDIGIVYMWEEHTDVSVDKDGYKANVKKEYVVQGKYKYFSTAQSMSKEQKKIYMRVVESIYSWFTGQVAKLRGLKLEDLDVWADGKLFSAVDAQELGLVDVLGTWSDAEDKFKGLWQQRGMGKFDKVNYILQNGTFI